jgi:hypothetical protein
LVTLAIGRWVLAAWAHSTWPVAASASTAPSALTPPGAPATSIAGLASDRSGDGLGDADPPAARVAVPVGTGIWADADPALWAGDPHAAAAAMLVAATASEAIRNLNRIQAMVSVCGVYPSSST